MKLKLADSLSLPLDFATKTAAILAQRRKGKTYTASIIAEEMVAAKQPFVALDPTGAWWGLRAGADGKSEGLPVVVLGGQHGDVPLERTGGRLIADLVVEEPGYYVIDFSFFESGEAERQFAVDFAERLYRAKGQPGRDFPLHLFVDEADRFIPQQMRKGSNETSPRLLGAFEAIVRRGGLRGLGTTLISQRAALVNKNVLEMLDILIALRTVGPNDRDAIAGYIDAHGTDEEKGAMMGSLASLDIGEAWVWEPGAEPPLFQRVRIRKRHTFNSSATPKPGEKRVEPKRLADVDLAALQKRMAETIEKAKADDPRELRKQISALNGEVANWRKRFEKWDGSPARKIERTPVLTDADRALLEKLAARLKENGEALVEAVTSVSQSIENKISILVNSILLEKMQGIADARTEIEKTLESKGLKAILEKLTNIHPTTTTNAEPRNSQPRRVAPAAPAMSSRPTRLVSENGNGVVKGGKFRSMMVALAQAGKPLQDGQLSARAGMALSGTFDTYIGQMRQNGWVIGTRQDLQITDDGLRALGPYEELPTGAALQRYWLDKMGSGKKREMLRVLIEAYPKAIPDDQVAHGAAMSLSGTFDTYIGQLRALMLVEGPRSALRASEELF